jgi:hypothetical protein
VHCRKHYVFGLNIPKTLQIFKSFGKPLRVFTVEAKILVVAAAFEE